MPTSTPTQEQLQQAQRQLEAQYLNHPDVTLIDTGYVMQDGKSTGTIALRIHTRSPSNQHPVQTVFPSQINGVPVVVMVGDYQLERGSEPAEDP